MKYFIYNLARDILKHTKDAETHETEGRGLADKWKYKGMVG